MGEIVDISEQAHEAAVAASKPGKFSFLDRVQSRNYPTDEVAVYLNEAAGYTILDIAAKLDDERNKQKLLVKTKDAEAKKAVAEEIASLEAQLDVAREAAASSRFVFHLQGISTEDYDKLVDMATREFPLEYRENRNPLTFALEREVIENEQREIYFRTLLWAKFIQKVEDPEGNVDDEITQVWVARTMGLIPVMGQYAIQQGIEKLRMTTNWMDAIQGEDFFPKS